MPMIDLKGYIHNDRRLEDTMILIRTSGITNTSTALLDLHLGWSNPKVSIDLQGVKQKQNFSAVSSWMSSTRRRQKAKYKGIGGGVCRLGGGYVDVFRFSLENSLLAPAVDRAEPSGGSSRLHGRNVGSLLAPEHDGVDHVLQDRHMRSNIKRRR